MEDSAAKGFRSALKQVLDECHPAWQKRHRWRKRGAEPPLGVWADTLEAWTTGDSFPNPDPFEDFLRKAALDDETCSHLKQLYEHARSTHRRKHGQNEDHGVVVGEALNNQMFFAGRDTEMAELQKFLLQPPDKVRVLTLHALGGMGKTALARALIAELEKTRDSGPAVWIDAGTERFDDGIIYPTSGDVVTIDSIVRQVTGELGLDSGEEGQKSLLLNKLKQYLQRHPMILVLDNFETVADKDRLLTSLLELLGPLGRLLVTTRETFDAPNQIQYSLGPILQKDGPAFLRGWAEVLRVKSVVGAPDDVLLDIWTKAGGLPLAMRLVVGQLYNQPLNLVLEYLVQAQARLNDGSQHPNSEFYRFLYARSWAQLDLTSRQLLVWVALHPAGVAVPSLLSMTGLNLDGLYSAMKPLQQACLVDLEGALGKERYNCHPITRYFVLGTIKDEPNDSAQ